MSHLLSATVFIRMKMESFSDNFGDSKVFIAALNCHRDRNRGIDGFEINFQFFQISMQLLSNDLWYIAQVSAHFDGTRNHLTIIDQSISQ